MEKERQPHYTIRPAILNDVEAIRRMQAQSWRDTYENNDIGVTKDWLAEETKTWLTPDRLEDSRQHLAAVFENNRHFYRVALRGDEVVGLLHVDTKDDGTKHLWGLYTAKDTHGTGLAQELMALADDWIGESDVDLEVATYNGRAKAFYEKNGFVEVGETGQLFREKIPIVKMQRKSSKL